MADAFHKQCADATVSILVGLQLPEILGNVVFQLLEEPASDQQPIAIVLIQDQPMPVANFTTASRLVKYPVVVRIKDRVFPPADDRLDIWTGWQQSVLDAFPDRALPSYPPGTIGCEVMSKVTIEQSGSAFNLAEGDWLLLFRAVRPN